MLPFYSLDTEKVAANLAEEIHFREVDDFVAAPAENCSQHEEAEAFGLIESNGRWHGELLPAHKDFDQSRSVMLESLRNHGHYLIRCFGRESKETCGVCDLREIWVVQICSKIDDAGCFHFQLHKSQRVVLEDNHLDRHLQLPKREQIAHEHRESAVPGQRDHLTARMTHLRSNGLRERIGHGTVIEGADYPPFAVHRQVAGRPNRRSANVAGENSVLRSELVEHSGKILRMDGPLTLSICRKFIEALACLTIVLDRGIQVRIELVLVQFWQKGTDGCLRISDKAVVDFCAPAQLFSTDINLNNRCVLGIELLVRKVGTDHQKTRVGRSCPHQMGCRIR